MNTLTSKRWVFSQYAIMVSCSSSANKSNAVVFRLVCSHKIHLLDEHDTARKAMPHVWSGLTRKGILDQRLLPHLWKQNTNQVHHLQARILLVDSE